MHPGRLTPPSLTILLHLTPPSPPPPCPGNQSESCESAHPRMYLLWRSMMSEPGRSRSRLRPGTTNKVRNRESENKRERGRETERERATGSLRGARWIILRALETSAIIERRVRSFVPTGRLENETRPSPPANHTSARMAGTPTNTPYDWASSGLGRSPSGPPQSAR